MVTVAGKPTHAMFFINLNHVYYIINFQQ